jgi:hypothetical protein
MRIGKVVQAEDHKSQDSPRIPVSHHQVKLVLALTALHNFIRRHAQGREDRFYREADIERERELAAGDSDLGSGRVAEGPVC